MTQQDFQRQFCEGAEQPILNIACKEDPSHLGKDFDAINLDLLDYDPHTRTNLLTLPNFVPGDARNLPFKDGSFSSAVMGEFIEHCVFDVAVVCVKEAMRVLKPGGKLCLTFPLDGRPKEGQHAPEHLVEWAEGITSWHQTVWGDESFSELLEACDVREVSRVPIGYGFADGLGVIVESAEKPKCRPSL